MVAYQGYTTFDARLDIVAAMSQIRKLQGTQTNTVPEKVYVVAHCVGSLALSCGPLDGMIPAEYIKGSRRPLFYYSDFGQGKQDKSEQVNADESIIQRSSGFMVQLYE